MSNNRQIQKNLRSPSLLHSSRPTCLSFPLLSFTLPADLKETPSHSYLLLPPCLMAHLPTRSFQAYQVFAANTNVGKTILSTGLVRAAAALSVGAEKQKRAATKAFYLKPVQTGYPVDCDAR